MPRAATWAEVDWLRAHSHLPLLLKGANVHPDDAREAVARGVAGLIVSNHGGRTLDTLPPTAALLPRVREGRRALSCRCWSMAASAAAPMC